MSKDLVTIDHSEYGMEETRANEIAKAFQPMLSEMIGLESEYEEFKNLVGEPPKDTCAAAKALKKKYTSTRTETAAVHKAEKAAYLNAGRYVDAWKNRQAEICREREDHLSGIADYHINLEKERMRKLRETRFAELSEFLDEELIPQDLGVMKDDVYTGYLSSVKAQHIAKIEAEKQAEADRIAKETAEREEQERIRKENEKLRKDAEEKEKALEKERKEREKKEAAERAERERVEAERQAQINKERKAAEEKLRKEREEKERLEREDRERKAAEEAKKQALLKGSDSEKLLAYFRSFSDIPNPVLESEEATKIFNQFIAAITSAVSQSKRL